MQGLFTRDTYIDILSNGGRYVEDKNGYVGRLLKVIREKKLMSITDFANRAGIDEKLVIEVECGCYDKIPVVYIERYGIVGKFLNIESVARNLNYCSTNYYSNLLYLEANVKNIKANLMGDIKRLKLDMEEKRREIGSRYNIKKEYAKYKLEMESLERDLGKKLRQLEEIQQNFDYDNKKVSMLIEKGSIKKRIISVPERVMSDNKKKILWALNQPVDGRKVVEDNKVNEVKKVLEREKQEVNREKGANREKLVVENNGIEYTKEMVSRILQSYMLKNDYKMVDLVNISGFARTTVSDWVNGRVLPNKDRLIVFLDVLGIDKRVFGL